MATPNTQCTTACDGTTHCNPFAYAGEQQRSPRALSLLQWYYHSVNQDPRIVGAVRRYFAFLKTSAAQETYQLKQQALVTGFVGLATADLISPYCTFYSPDACSSAH